MKYKRCEIFDSTTENIMEHMEAATSFIETVNHSANKKSCFVSFFLLLQAKYHGKILVHCNKGVSRSVSVVVGYLMKYKDMNIEESLAKIRETRPQASPNSAFLKQLEDFDAKLQKERAESGDHVRSDSPQREKVSKASRGPDLPPHLQHMSKNCREEAQEAQVVVKGPQLPPHLQHLIQQGSTDDGADKEVQKEEEPAVVKGPQLPPHLQHLIKAREDAEPVAKKAKLG